MSNCITNNHLKLKYNSISQIINHNMSKKIVDAHFGKAQQQEEAQQYGQKRVSKLRKKPLSSNGRNYES